MLAKRQWDFAFIGRSTAQCDKWLKWVGWLENDSNGENGICISMTKSIFDRMNINMLEEFEFRKAFIHVFEVFGAPLIRTNNLVEGTWDKKPG